MTEDKKPETCCAKLGQPDMLKGMKVCGKPVVYVDASATSDRYSGWYHTEGGQDHHAVPSSLIR